MSDLKPHVTEDPNLRSPFICSGHLRSQGDIRDYKKDAAKACEPRLCGKLGLPLTLHDDLSIGLAQAQARDPLVIRCVPYTDCTC